MYSNLSEKILQLSYMKQRIIEALSNPLQLTFLNYKTAVNCADSPIKVVFRINCPIIQITIAKL